jgi:hypothetical protein
MMIEPFKLKEVKMDDALLPETLDPEHWDDMRALAHQMIDDAFHHLETVRERPVWQPVPEAVAAKFQVPVPLKPEGADATYKDFKETILPYPMGNDAPAILGLVHGQRYGDGCAGRLYGFDHEFQPWRRQSCFQPG